MFWAGTVLLKFDFHVVVRLILRCCVAQSQTINCTAVSISSFHSNVNGPVLCLLDGSLGRSTRELGISAENVGLHAFRHGLATELAESEPITVLQTQMRHADFTDKLSAERLVQPALMELTEHQRETLWLYFPDGYTLREISTKRREGRHSLQGGDFVTGVDRCGVAGPGIWGWNAGGPILDQLSGKSADSIGPDTLCPASRALFRFLSDL
jgi:hypothetical protein